MTPEKHLKLLLPYYIKEYRNVIPPDLAKQIITQPDLKFYPATTGGGKKSEVRHCYNKYLEPKFSSEISKIFDNIFKSYIQEFRFFDSVKIEQVSFDPINFLHISELMRYLLFPFS